ncbi:unnamed protein product [Phytophthora lilii]|uniref:Unnamed protein product n=1 Tax=Phytophthora lilii TaxID=2077276 RepID=A0A9W6TR61_9STRA|nr:unnamed protein product [Phytophthora lilii]
MLQRRLREDLTPSEQLQSKLHVDANDAALFEEFLGDLDVVHAATDQVFRDCGLHETPLVPFRMEPAWNREGDVQYIEKLDVLLLPFSFEDTCEVMWESMRHVYRQQDRRHYNGAVDGENTVAVKLRLRPPTETGELAEMTVLFVIRRYVEPGRMVIVWRALSEGEGKFFGMHCDETGWSVVCPSGNAGDEMMPTVMQTLVRFRPLNVRVTSADHVDGYHFTKLVVTSAEEDASEIARMMDALLLEVSS